VRGKVCKAALRRPRGKNGAHAILVLAIRYEHRMRVSARAAGGKSGRTNSSRALQEENLVNSVSIFLAIGEKAALTAS
jgi:hypothetical protein